MARPRKNVTALQGNYSKEMIQDRLEQEKSITGDSDNVVIPLFIKHDEIAVEEFLRIVEELNDILEKNGIQCFFTYESKNDRYTFRTFEGTLIDNNFVTQCKIYLKTENKNRG